MIPNKSKRKMIVKKALFGFAALVGVALIAWIGFSYKGSNNSRFAGPTSPEDPLPAALITDLESYVTRAMKQNDVPGVSMVLVQGDQVYDQEIRQEARDIRWQVFSLSLITGKKLIRTK